MIKDCDKRFVTVKNIDFVNDTLISLITPEIKVQYKKFVYNSCISGVLSAISNTKFYVDFLQVLWKWIRI